MAEILGLGVTHSPPLLGTDERMAGILERVMRSPHVPAALRDPSGWPAPMQHEWAEHQAGRLAGPAPPAPGRGVPRGARRAGRVQSRSRADLGRRPVRELPRGRRRAVLRLRVGHDRVTPLRAPRQGGERLGRAERHRRAPARPSRRRPLSRRRRWWSRASTCPMPTPCGMKPVCRMRSSTRCCCWTTTARACPGRCCRSM